MEDVADEDYLPLGTAESVAEAIRAAFPGAQWSGPTSAIWALDEDTAVMINFADVESTNAIQVSVSGTGNRIPHLLALANANAWVVLDCATTEFLSESDSATEGWAGYQSLLQQLRGAGPTTG
jgi:hypothetical protein